VHEFVRLAYGRTELAAPDLFGSLLFLYADIQGTPQRWITLQQAALHYATDTVVWVDGEAPLRTLRGGFNAASGRLSAIEIHPIIALRGAPKSTCSTWCRA
jgi:hypothetical protein